MTTTITKVVGTGGDYTTPQLFEDACPADLTAVDQIWRGECKNQNHSIVSFSGVTTDSTRYIELTAQAGASFIDNATKVGRVDTTKGATLRTTSSYTVVVVLNSTLNIKISRLQFEIAGAVGGSSPVIFNNIGPSNVDINQCIVESNRSNVINLYNGNLIRNSIVTNRGSGVATIASLRAGATAINCTFAVPSDKTPATVAITGQYSAGSLQSCAIFGASALSAGTAPTYTTCATDITGTTGITGGVAYSTSTFVGTTDAARDFRLVSGSALLDAGTTDVLGLFDIYGTARPQGSAYDIGAHELVAAAAGFIPRGVLVRQAMKRASFF